MNGLLNLFPNQIQNRTTRTRAISDGKAFEIIELIKNNSSALGREIINSLSEIFDLSVNYLQHAVGEWETHRFYVMVPDVATTYDYFDRTREHFACHREAICGRLVKKLDDENSYSL